MVFGGEVFGFWGQVGRRRTRLGKMIASSGCADMVVTGSSDTRRLCGLPMQRISFGWGNRLTVMAAEKVKLLTLAIVHRDGRVLLGMKKRGFGEGYFNGFGGKVENGETIEQAAARELEEEAGITPTEMEKRGILTFHFDDKPVPWEVHVYHVEKFVGDPSETEEMCPRWFATGDIPFDRMWKDDPIWYPHFLQGSLFRGEFYFRNTHELVSHSFHVVSSLCSA